jgi:hypothetical protein
MKKPLARRDFLKNSAALAAFFGLPTGTFSEREIKNRLERLSEIRPAGGKPVFNLKHAPILPVKAAIIGLGNRGEELLRLLTAIGKERVVVSAICDIRQHVVDQQLDILAKSGYGKPASYGGSPDAWKSMVHRDDIDLVLVCTPWEDHTPMCLYSMNHGKHVACEVPIAYILDDCWALVHTAEATQRHCIMLENVCYGEEEMWLLNMVAQGLFGRLTYAECAYIHDLRELLFSKTYYYNMWRIRHNEANDGNLYPTHGLGPVAQYMNIHRGDKFDFLVSVSSLQLSLDEHARTVEPDNEFYNRTGFRHGDMNNTIIKTAKGRTILVQHDTATNRPYSRINMLAGTEAFHNGYPSRLSFKSSGHAYLKSEAYQQMKEKYRHPLWQKLQDEAIRNGGHGGMDFVMLYRLVDCLNRGLPLDIDVYDGVAWSVVTPLSQVSVELGSVPVRFPDFTRGRWEEERTIGPMLNW